MTEGFPLTIGCSNCGKTIECRDGFRCVCPECGSLLREGKQMKCLDEFDEDYNRLESKFGNMGD